MATRGAKPKPAHLRLVDGTHRNSRHGDPAALDETLEAVSPLQKPAYLKAGTRAAKLWEEIAGLCWWLGDADSYKLGMWCAMQAEFEKSPGKMTSARIAQLRALGSELGLDPSSRSRLGSMKGNRGGKGQAEKPGQEGAAKKDYFAG